MRRSPLLPRLSMIMILGTGVARAADGPLPLDAGHYVAASYEPCDQAPLAGVTSFDGRSFVGPHDADCETTILEQHGADYRVQVRCTAQGDGTPVAAAPFVHEVRIKSRTAFTLVHGATAMDYALCPAFH